MSATDTSVLAPACKTPRERILRLKVEAEICPQVLLRILDLLSRQWITPLAISAERGLESIRIEVDVSDEELPEPRAALLLAKVEEIAMVRTAALSER